MGSKVKCKLCNCDGVNGTVLCREHLEGYAYAMKLLVDLGHIAASIRLRSYAKQQPIVS